MITYNMCPFYAEAVVAPKAKFSEFMPRWGDLRVFRVNECQQNHWIENIYRLKPHEYDDYYSPNI